MEPSIKDVIKNRKSVRTFAKKPLKDEDLRKIESYVKTIENPFGVPVEFRILDAKERSIDSSVIAGADVYVAAKVSRVKNCEIAFGYSFEEFCLYAASIGLGTVMMAATFSRKTAEKAVELGDNEVLPAVSPIGYPAEKRSVRDAMIRKAVKADKRLPFGQLFFEETFGRPLKEESAGRFAWPLAMVRLAPSAANKQPWRAVVSGDNVYFYEKKTIAESPLGDIQKVDMGIALAHFDLTCKEDGIGGRFEIHDPQIAAPEGTEYIITYQAERG